MKFFITLTMMAFAWTLATADSDAKDAAAVPAQKNDSTAATSPADTLPPIEKMPVLKKFIKADYPAALVKKGIEGTVVLDLVVSDSGRVDSVAVVRGVHPLLDSSAAHTVARFLFDPAMAGGKPIAVLLQYAYRFTIDSVVTAIDEFVNFKGRLYERGSRSPLQNATVMVSFPDTAADTSLKVPFHAYLKKIGAFKDQYLSENTLVATSDSAGYFEFRSLPSGPITIKVVMAEFENFTDREQISRGKATEVTFRLQRNAIGENEIVVYGKAEKKEVAQRTLTLNEVRKIPGLGGDAVKVVQALPGVARSAFSSGSIIVRGSGTGDSHFYVDGVTIPVLFHFGGIKSTYNSDALESVDLYPGGFGTRYGNTIGGVIELKGRKPKTDRFHGYLDANLFDASFLVEGPVSDKISFLASGRRSYIADALALALDVLNVKLPFTVAPYYWDYLARMDYNVSKTQHAYVTLFGSSDKLDIIIAQARGAGSSEVSSDKNQVNSETTFHLGIAGWEWDLGKKTRNEFKYAICNLYENQGALAFFTSEGRALAHYLRDELTYTPSSTLKWSFGTDFQIVPFDIKLSTSDQNNKIVHDSEHIDLGPYGAYVNAEYLPFPRLKLIPGLRYDYYPELTYKGSILPEFWDYRSFNNNRGISGEPSFRMTARYELEKGKTVKASAGCYNNTPQPQGQAVDKKWGTTTLPAQKASQYVLGYEWKLSDLVSADVQGYFNKQWDVTRPPGDTEIKYNPSLADIKYLSNGKARMDGLELLLKHDQGKRFFGWLSYSLSRSERWNYNENRWAIYSQDQTHNIQFIGSYKLTPTQELGARIRYVTGNPTTPVLGLDYYDWTNRRDVAKYGPFNSGRVDPYTSFDFRYEKKFTYNLWQLFAYIEVTHLENWFGKGYLSPEVGTYRWSYDFDPASKLVISDFTRPALGLRVEF
jgi:TonB family protein